MTRTIKEVLEELWWHGERYGTGTVGKDELSKEEAHHQALSEIEKIMDGVIGEDLPLEQPPDEEMEQIELLGNRLFRKGANWSKANRRQSLKEVLGE